MTTKPDDLPSTRSGRGATDRADMLAVLAEAGLPFGSAIEALLDRLDRQRAGR